MAYFLGDICIPQEVSHKNQPVWGYIPMALPLNLWVPGLHMYMTWTLPLFTGDSGLTTPSTQEPVKLAVSHDVQSGMCTFSMYCIYMCVCALLCQ